MSDDISMGALSGSLGERTRAAIAAGCDLVLHCNGEMPEMLVVAAEAPSLAGEAGAPVRGSAGGAKTADAIRSRRRPRRIQQTDGRSLAAGAGIRMIAEDIAVRTEFPEQAADEPALVIDVEGFEGPLDLLLTLARQQKVDLAKISILALADQYLAFIEEARKLRLELAADYLVMAAWLAYLKSRLLLPEQPQPDGLSAEDLATALAQRLRRLEAIRQVAEQLLAGRNLAARCLHAVFRSRLPRSRSRNGRRRFTICFRLTRDSGRHRRVPMCACRSVRSGRWPRRAKRSNG